MSDLDRAAIALSTQEGQPDPTAIYASATVLRGPTRPIVVHRLQRSTQEVNA